MDRVFQLLAVRKRIGPAGQAIVIVREDLLGHALPICPSAFNYQTVADHDPCTTPLPPGAFTWQG